MTALTLHHYLSRLIPLTALILLILGLGLTLSKKDVTPWLRTLAYALSGLIFLQAILGTTLYVRGSRALEPDIHLVYGLGISLLMPFFIYVERTAEKRPAVGSFIIGALLVVGMSFRSILTGG
jgi:heme A synthase